MKTIDLSTAEVRELNQALHDQAKTLEEREWVVIWQDNYFELMPGEERQVTGVFSYPGGQATGTPPTLAVDGWNVALTTYGGVSGKESGAKSKPERN